MSKAQKDGRLQPPRQGKKGRDGGKGESVNKSVWVFLIIVLFVPSKSQFRRPTSASSYGKSRSSGGSSGLNKIGFYIYSSINSVFGTSLSLTILGMSHSQSQRTVIYNKSWGGGCDKFSFIVTVLKTSFEWLKLRPGFSSFFNMYIYSEMFSSKLFFCFVS